MTLCADQEFSKDIFLWLGVIVLAAIVLGVIALVLRRVLMGEQAAPQIGFTLADLRRLHEDGELSDEEFAQAKGRMLAQGRAMLDDAEGEDSPDAMVGPEQPVDDSGFGEEPPGPDSPASR